MDDPVRIEIRSYRAVFDLERRLYRIDRYRLNPSGVPVRGLVHLVAAVVAVLLAERAPLAGVLVGALPWQARYVALPCLAAALLTIVRVDGRAAHVALASMLRFAAAPRHLSAFARRPRPGTRWTPPAIGVIGDGSGGPTRLAFRGPGAVLVRAPHRLERRGRRVTLTLGDAPPGPGAGEAIVLRPGATLRVRR